ncbi:MAG: saccharopine dehydrogenase NADP-binding domain-containing protein [Deltaproteobacteria bacterium]|nr:saccharopine dehydrogenase NADP-binding domain-containing protein [Deltaproteobacteria bacterium]
MKVLILGMGLQGKAVVHDLEESSLITDIIVADQDLAMVEKYISQKGLKKTRGYYVNADVNDRLDATIRETGAQLVICMIPPDYGFIVAQAALKAGIPFVSSSYTGRILELDGEARSRGISILPEMGMDPGIDLILGRLAIDELDEVKGLYSYGAGLPEPVCAADNPLNYKITWTFNGVLKAYKRPAQFLKNGEVVSVPGEKIFRKEYIHDIYVPELGILEAYPNGDAVHYISVFKLSENIQNMGRFALRWPGHSQFWRIIAELGFLDDTPEKIAGADISPRQFLVEHLTPRLQFRENERDIVILLVKAWGIKSGKKVNVTYSLTDYRDLSTGLFAMNRTVGFTASIGAQMILSGKIQQPGVLSPALHVPPQILIEELSRRGMQVRRQCGEINDNETEPTAGS